MANLWQQPYVNVFKHVNIQSWKRSSKEGEVVSTMDRTLKCTVYKVTGSIPAGNYIQLPKTSSQSLGLTGKYMYLLFRPIPSKYFVVHIDVATQDGLIVRISFSNLFKEFKSTSTWLQFPFICNAATGTICGHTAVSKDHSGPAPVTTRWTVLSLDYQYILSMYLNRRYAYMKSIKICANLSIKNIFTSDTEYEPGVTFEQVKKTGLTLNGLAPMPRDMAFPLSKSQSWNDLYDMIRFPSDGKKKPFDSIQFSPTKEAGNVTNGSLGTISPRRLEPKTVHCSRSTTDGSSMMEKVVTSRKIGRKREVVRQLPPVGIDEGISVQKSGGDEVHVFAHPEEKSRHSRGEILIKKPAVVKMNGDSEMMVKNSCKALVPDPILKLRRVVGFGGCETKDAIWTENGTSVVYPCHGLIVSMQINNGNQRFFIGHTDKVSCISLNGKSTLLASGQTGPQSVIRLWRFHTAECVAMFKAHTHSLSLLSMSHCGSVLCGVGKDSHGKNMVVIWNTANAMKGGHIPVIAKAHTEVDIVRMRIALFDDTRMVSCGRDNIRLWRVKDGSLRSAPVNLAEHHSMEFTDCCFEAGFHATKDPLDRMVYACSKSGHIFEIDYQRVAVHHVRRLLPVAPASKEKQTFKTGGGISINCLHVNEAFCVTGSDDGYLRLWPLDFNHVYLEAEHEGPVTAVNISSDGVKILAGTSSGTLGILDVATRGYTTLMRSHTGRVLTLSVDPIRRQLVTASEDHTIRIWDMDTMQQVYDFTAPKECPCAVAYHPSQQVFACGFESGAVRVFNVATTSLLAEQRQHRGKVVGLAYAPAGDYLYSAGSLGSIAMYDAADNKYQLLRLLGNTLARGETHGPEALAVSLDGKHVAFVGPTNFTISIVEARSLDEVLRIDITSLNTADNSRTVIDSALRVKYAPTNVKQLLVITTSHKLLKFDSRNGKILAEIDNIHRGDCTALDTTIDGRHLVTAGDKMVKIWDYHMRLDLNFQVFIGHSESISRAVFTPDQLGFISCGEAIFLWDFLANHNEGVPQMEGRSKVKNYFTGEVEEPMLYKSPVKHKMISSHADLPRQHAPVPTSYEPGEQVANLSDIKKVVVEELMGADIVSQSSEKEDMLFDTELPETITVNNVASECVVPEISMNERSVNTIEHHQINANPDISSENTQSSPEKTPHPVPSVDRHFTCRRRTHALAQRRYTAPPNQAGLKMKSVIGYNGNGRNNMVWHPEAGIFAYTNGTVIVVEDLTTGEQKHLQGHHEEISTLALQHDCQIMASASGASGLSVSQICLWDIHQFTCKKVLSHHEHQIVSLDYSRDDRFLLSIGDYRECNIVIWSTHTYNMLATTTTSVPLHSARWDPFTVNEFCAVGSNGTVLFWMLDETGNDGDAALNVHEAQIPAELLQTHHMGAKEVEFTCMEYVGDSTLYIATNTGKVSVWDTRHNTCFMHWEAGNHEIDILIGKGGRLVTGSSDKTIKMWSVVGVGELKLPGDNNNMRQGGLVMEDEIDVDGGVVSAQFEETLDMGIIGTTSGTLWYINWPERASIRLVSGHQSRINAIAFANEDYIACCGDDGSVKIWTTSDREQVAQFLVLEQAGSCLAFAPTLESATKTTISNLESAPVMTHATEEKTKLPNLVVGYSDGTVRMFDLQKLDMVLKMHPHPVSVTAITFSADGRMIVSGGSDGLIALSSPTTGMTVRVLNDHGGAPITCINVAHLQEQEAGIHVPQLWLAASADRRISVWSADWSRDLCELVDWLTFPAPAFTPDGAVIKKNEKSHYQELPPSLAVFSVEEPDIIIYTGYGMHKQIQFYSMSQRKVLRTIPLTHWATSLDLCRTSALLGVGINERLLKLQDYYEGSFQDFTGHSDALNVVCFSPSGKLAVTVAHSEMIMWQLVV